MLDVVFSPIPKCSLEYQNMCVSFAELMSYDLQCKPEKLNQDHVFVYAFQLKM